MEATISALHHYVLAREPGSSIPRYTREHIRLWGEGLSSVAGVHSRDVHGRMSCRTFRRDGCCFCGEYIEMVLVLHISTRYWCFECRFRGLRVLGHSEIEEKAAAD